MSSEPVAAAIAALGGPAAVSRRRGLKSPWSVSKWIREGLPPEHVLWLAAETGYRFSPHDLAPAYYPHPDDGLPVERRALQASA